MEKRLRRSGNNSMLAGVCGGIGEYLDVDPTIIRLVALVLGFSGTGLFVYIVAAIIMPDEI